MKKQNFKLLLAILAVSFFFLSGFSPILHSHDFDLDGHTQDCYSCSWNASGSLIESAVATDRTNGSDDVDSFFDLFEYLVSQFEKEVPLPSAALATR